MKNTIKKVLRIGMFFLILFLNACSNSPAISSNPDASFSDTSNTFCMIDIRGEVVYPGIYKIEVGSLFNDAIQLAGGITKNANLDDINLVAIITQNIKIVIPSKKEEIVDKTKININTCTIEELLTIPKIGITKANAIIAYRNANGSFTNIEELKEVDGIGDVIFEEIKVYITI